MRLQTVWNSMGEYPSRAEIKKRLNSTVSRIGKLEQGDEVYGVAEFNNDPPSGNWARGGKLFIEDNLTTKGAKEGAEEYFYTEQPLRNPDFHDTVLYKGVAAESTGGRDTMVVDPSEEVEITLTNIEILDRRKPGESL